MKRTRLVCVGACAIDTILTIPHFPEEDSKLRATSFSKRRGGNTPNTLEVLQQLIDEHYEFDGSTEGSDVVGAQNSEPELFLIATLPARSSTQVDFIASSFKRPHPSRITNRGEYVQDSPAPSFSSKVDLSHCVYREEYTEPISSYIFSSQSTSSRTIINNNVLPEMRFEEFVHQSRDLLNPSITPESKPVDQVWFHFEGRIADTTHQCIQYLRNHDAFRQNSFKTSTPLSLKISTELEKPGREGLQDLAHEADLIFYSKAWARGEGYQTAEQCLKGQAEILSTNEGEPEMNRKTLICTWGEQGAYASVLPPRRSLPSRSDATRTNESSIIHSPAYIAAERPVIDSIGAGDTFIAGVLFGLICRSSEDQADSDPATWSLKQTLSFATGLASRKILQDGFQDLGREIRNLRETVDGDRE